MTWILIIWLRGSYQIGSPTIGPTYASNSDCQAEAIRVINAGLNAICIKGK